MSATANAILANPTFCPRLRGDVRFLTGSKADTVIVHDTRTDRKVELYAIECQIAKAMDGTRDLDALAKVTEASFGFVPIDQVAKVAAQIAGMGLIENIGELGIDASTRATRKRVSKANHPPDTGGERLGIGENTAVIAIDKIDGAPSNPSWGESNEDEDEEQTETQDDYEESYDHEPEPEHSVGADGYDEDADSMDYDDEQDYQEHEEQAWQPESPDEQKSYRLRQKAKKLLKYGIFAAILLVLALFPWPLYVTEPCEVRPLDRIELRSEVTGIVAETLVNEGDFVEEGQLLARLDDRILNHQLARAKAEVQGLLAKLEKLEAGSRPEEIRQAKAHVTAAKADHAIAKRKYLHAQELFKKDVGSRRALDDAKGVLDVRAREVAEAKAALNLVEAGFRDEEIKIGKAELTRAESDVAFLEQQLELLEIRAPQKGRVLTPKFHEKRLEKIEAGDTVVEIGDPTTMRIEVSVPEKFADVLEIGQSVEIKVHSYPLKSFHGEIVFISPSVSIVDGDRVLRVDANVENGDGMLQPRMTGWAEINAGTSTPLGRIFRSAARWIRVRFLL